ncbi:MAG: hypothetical protein KF784_00315 [Fimbriimonadaceae bacterium]|nr:hypothetical protein [Fimbriimonadaceae bacterium]
MVTRAKTQLLPLSEWTANERSALFGRSVASIALLMLGYAAATLYPTAHAGARVWTLLPLLISALLLQRMFKRSAHRLLVFAPLLALPIIGQAWHAAALMTLQIALTASYGRRSMRRWFVLPASASLLLTVLLYWESTGLMWRELPLTSWAVSLWVTEIQGHPQRLGPDYVGLPWLFLALSVTFIAAIRLRGRRLWLVAPLVALFLFAAAMTMVTSSLAPLILDVFLAVFMLGSSPSKGWIEPRWVRLGAVIASTSLLLGSILAGWGGRIDAPRKLVVLEPGLGTLDFPERLPTNRQDTANAHFGLLVRHLQKAGWEATAVPQEEVERAIPGVSVLCVANPQKAFTVKQREAIRRFVSEGGALLVLGDHTDIGDIQAPLDELLSFTSIRFRFDSAIDLAGTAQWMNGLRGSPTPGFAGRENSDFRISIGASLDVGPSARVLITGDRGFSDMGDASTGPSKLGDMMYTGRERLGGIILAAEERVGKGTVVVFGDTSGFQDSTLSFNHEWRMQLFERLRSYRSLGASWLLVYGLVLLSVLTIWTMRRSPALIACVFAAVAAVTALIARPLSTPAPDLSSNVLFDTSHWPAVVSSKEGSELYRLGETVVRTGSELLLSNDFDRMLASKPRQVIVAAPTKPYTMDEARRLLEYVKEGGRLIISANATNNVAMAKVAAAFEYSVSSRLIGIAPDSRVLDANWRFSIPIDRTGMPEVPFRHANPISGDQWEPVVECWGETIVARRQIGKGRVILIADDEFVTDANVGRQATIDVEVVQFLVHCLEW